MNITKIVLITGIGLLLSPFTYADSLITESLTFTPYYGLQPTSGSFVYDKSTKQFDSFIVTWDGVNMDFAPSASLYGEMTGKVAGFPTFTFDCESNPAYPEPCGNYELLQVGDSSPTFVNGDFPPLVNIKGSGLLGFDPPSRIGPRNVDETRLVSTPEPPLILLVAFGGFLLSVGALVYRKQNGYE
jgi:hypothetical protein